MPDVRKGFQAKVNVIAARANTHRQQTVRVPGMWKEVSTAIAPDAASAHPCQREAVRMRILRAHVSTARHPQPAPAHPFG